MAVPVVQEQNLGLRKVEAVHMEPQLAVITLYPQNVV